MTMTLMRPLGPDLKVVDEDGRPIEDRDPMVELRGLQLRERLVTADEVKNLPPPDYLVGGVLLRSSLALMHGPPGSFKSFVAQHIAYAVASGSEWAGRPVIPGPVLYIAGEGVSGLGQRVAAWQEHERIHQLPELMFLGVAVNLLDSGYLDALVEIVMELEPELVVVDTLARCIPGAEENSARDMGMAVAALDRLKTACGSTVIVVHHQRKDGQSARGSGALLGAVDTSIEVGRDGPIVMLRAEKQKDGPEFEPFRMWTKPVGTSLVLVDRPPVGTPIDRLGDRQRVVLSTLAEIDPGGGMTASSWFKSLPNGVAERSFFRDRKTLLDVGLVGSDGTGRVQRYYLTDQGKGVLDD